MFTLTSNCFFPDSLVKLHQDWDKDFKLFPQDHHGCLSVGDIKTEFVDSLKSVQGISTSLNHHGETTTLLPTGNQYQTD